MNYKEILKRSICEITFNKVDGSKRVMRCTLKAECLPEVKVDSNKPNRTRKVAEGIVPVFDLDAKGWRSFREDSVVGFKVVE